MVEVLIDVTILAMIGMAVLSAFGSAFRSIAASKAKITAVSLANEKMEIVKNLPYDLVGISDPGIVPASQTELRNRISFTITTIISYYNDPADDINGSDDQPIDYKRVQINVSRSNSNIILAKLVTDIASNAAETEADTGIMRVCVHDSGNEIVAGSKVTVTLVKNNGSLVSTIIADELVDAVTGCLMLTGLNPNAGGEFYHIVINGPDGGNYSTAQTYSRTSNNKHEPFPDLDVQIQKVTDTNFTVEKLNELTIRAIDLATGNPVPNLSVRVFDFEKWFNPSTYRFDQIYTTDQNGEIKIEDIVSDVIVNGEFIRYTAEVKTAGWTISSADPSNPVYIPAGDADPPTNGVVMVLKLTGDSSAPTISSVSPGSGKTGIPLKIVVGGKNFVPNSEFKLVNGATEIAATGIQVSSDGNSISGQFNLTNAAIGRYDIFIKNLNSNQSVTKSNGFDITKK